MISNNTILLHDFHEWKNRAINAESKLDKMEKQLKKIGSLACTLDCMDEQESFARQKIFDIVKEFTGVNFSELVDITIVHPNYDNEIRKKLLFCKHKETRFIRNIYGDEIIHRGYKRSKHECTFCGTEIYKNELVNADK